MQEDIKSISLDLDSFKVIEPKWIVIHNYTQEHQSIQTDDINMQLQPMTKIFKAYIPHISLVMSVPKNMVVSCKAIGFLIYVCISQHTKALPQWCKDFYLACGGIDALFVKQASHQYSVYITDALTKHSIFNITMIDLLHIHFQHYNPNVKKLSETPEIPLNIHYIWLRKTPKTGFNAGYIHTWLEHHPNHNHYIWTDVKDGVPDDLAKQSNIHVMDMTGIKSLLNKYKDVFPNAVNVYNNIEIVGGKSDILRYIILYDMGGMYVDINDFECFKTMQDLFYQYAFVCGAETSFGDTLDNIYINNAIICSCQQHIILKRVLQLVSMDDTINHVTDIYKKDDDLAAYTGVGIFRAVVAGYFVDPYIDVKGKSDVIVLPSVYLYPSCFYDNTNMHLLNFKNKQEYWKHDETYASHYSHHSYL